MEVFNHHIYEFKKGLRRMVLHTTSANNRQQIINRLQKEKIAFLITPVTSKKINVFFGDKNCIEVIKTFSTIELSILSDEQDFILGVLLGYDTVLQCKRFLNRKSRVPESESFINILHTQTMKKVSNAQMNGNRKSEMIPPI